MAMKPEYRPTVVFGGDQVPVCTACGAVVGDAEAHTDWHFLGHPRDGIWKVGSVWLAAVDGEVVACGADKRFVQAAFDRRSA